MSRKDTRDQIDEALSSLGVYEIPEVDIVSLTFNPPRFPHTSVGTLRYSEGSEGLRLVVEVEQGVVSLARSLVPPSIPLRPQRYPPHITVVRRETLVRPDAWGRYDGEDLEFTYDSRVVQGDRYYWLRAWSDRLVEIRRELGLVALWELCRPPDNEDCFHITVGNLKHLGGR